MTREEAGSRDRTGRHALTWLLDRAFAVRPLLWIPAVAIFGAGRAWGIREHGHREFSAAPIASLLLILAAVHAANAWRDREADRINRKGLPVGSGAVDGATLLTLGAGSVVAATAVALGASILERWLLAASLVLGLAYVAPPLELKRRPIVDALSHGAGYGLVAFLLGAAGSGGLDRAGSIARALAAALPYALGIMTVALLTMLADLPGDERAGQRTTAVAFGPIRTETAARALAWGTLGTGLWAGDLTPTLWGALAAALIGLGAGAKSGSESSSWNALSVQLQLIFLVILAPQSPAPLLIAVLLGGASEAYNRWRWGVSYPLRAAGGGA
jgi:4-hydroxybenzoate polyprenyltransferase